jgi:rRNA maturation endonuclease Nob1
MSRNIVALRGDEFRIMCPACRVMWSTMTLPSECPDCGREVTLRIVQLRREADARLTPHDG